MLILFNTVSIFILFIIDNKQIQFLFFDGSWLFFTKFNYIYANKQNQIFSSRKDNIEYISNDDFIRRVIYAESVLKKAGTFEIQ